MSVLKRICGISDLTTVLTELPPMCTSFMTYSTMGLG